MSYFCEDVRRGSSSPASKLIFLLVACLTVLLAAGGILAAPQTGGAPATQATSMAQSQAELEQLAARLPITLDTNGAFTPLTIDPYATKDPAEVWNDWRMENKKDGEPPLLVITAHNMWAYLHGAPPGEEAGEPREPDRSSR